MGDMKTPDFDDLLAAFDIPDATGLDAKEPIHEGHDGSECQIKHSGTCLDDTLSVHQVVNSADNTVVSVIVKNTSRQETLESVEGKEGPHLTPTLGSHNEFRGPVTSIGSYPLINSDFSQSFASTLNGNSSNGLLEKRLVKQKSERTPPFTQSYSQFSPISSPESEDAQTNRAAQVYPKQEKPCFPGSLLTKSVDSLEYVSMFDECCQDDNTPGLSLKPEMKIMQQVESFNADQNDKAHCYSNSVLSPENDSPKKAETNCRTVSGSCMPILHGTYVKAPISKLSSCVDALADQNARQSPNQNTNHKDQPPVYFDGVKASPKVTILPQSPKSPEAVKHLMKPTDSPLSICSDSSGKASPAMTCSSSPAIPKVRIKTIKTRTGQIQRTVTSVLPDSETDELLSTCESSPSQSVTGEESCPNMSPYGAQHVARDSGIRSTPGTTQPSKMVHRKPEEPSKKAGLRQPPTIFHNTSRPAKRPVPQQGPKLRMSPSAPTVQGTNSNFLPKAMHLANLNLVPHSVAASAAARFASHQHSQHAFTSSMVCSSVPLVHQIKTVTPSPRTTTVTSTAAGTLNRLLNNANPLPTYVPNLSPPAGSKISLPPRGYCCLECGDSFGVERSLAFHYGRRSVHIEVACTHCAKTMVFYNKCALLAHAREHKNKGMVMQCTQLLMKPIAEGQMFVPQTPELPGKAVPQTSLTYSTKSQPVMPLYPDRVMRHRLCCLECNKQISDHRALASHYQRTSDNMEGLTCKVCLMLLPNQCSFKAHQRLHAHKSPYCCPECGALSRSADIQRHVKENCLHYSRKAGFKCLHCEVVLTSFNCKKKHIEERHCEVFHKCSVCPVAFKSSDSCEVHLKNRHNVCKMSPPRLIFKCSCETVFNKKQLLFEHFHQNSNKLAACVFKCPGCPSVFTHKQLLMEHFKSVHGGVFREEVERSTGQTDRTSLRPDVTSVPSLAQTQQPTKHGNVFMKKGSRPSKKTTGWTCEECLQWLPDRESYVSHMKKTHGKALKRHPCRQCERSFNSSTSLRRHIRNDHDGKKKTHTCWYCTDSKTTFTTSIILRNHISLMHGIKNPDFSQMPKEATAESCSAMREGILNKRLAMDSQGQGQKASPESSSAKRLKSQFRCSKCGFTTEDSLQFQQHIPQHRTHDDTPQCLHCGLCFASGLSLNRHQFIVHKVKEPEKHAEKTEWRENSVRIAEVVE